MIDFIKHLRLNYQFLILSGPFLLGGLLSPMTEPFEFILQFISVYICLFGGVTAYNSYWDKDEGPIGGLAHPPKMREWMLSTAWIIQLAGLLLALRAGVYFSAFYTIGLVFSVLYSHPRFRWKGKPALSFVAIGLGVASVPGILGYIAFGGSDIDLYMVLGTSGSTFLILSLYPFSQLYQIRADLKRGDRTFAAVYGTQGVIRSFMCFYFPGIVLISGALSKIDYRVSVAALFVGVSIGVYIMQVLSRSRSEESEYKKIMRTKYLGGMIFSLFMLALLIWLS